MGLEPNARHLIFGTIAELHADGHTVLLVEQNARAGLAAADWGAVLDGGRVAIAGPGPELLEDPRLAELYLGGAAANGRADGAGKPARVAVVVEEVDDPVPRDHADGEGRRVQRGERVEAPVSYDGRSGR